MKTQGLKAATNPSCPWQTELSPSRTRISVTVVQQVLRGVGGVDVGGAGVGSHAEQGEPSGGPELRVERELVLQLGDPVGVGAAARQVDVIAARIQAGAHHLEIGDGQGGVQDDGAAGFTDGAGNCGAIAGIETDSRDPWIVEPVR